MWRFKKIYQFLTKISCALSECHSKKIIHCDIKPYIFLDSEGNFKLGDFGVARELKDSTMTGTLYCLAPEVIEAKKLQ